MQVSEIDQIIAREDFLGNFQDKSNKLFAGSWSDLETLEITVLKKKNAELFDIFSAKRLEAIVSLKNSIIDQTKFNWFGRGVTQDDRDRISQLDFLNNIYTKSYSSANYFTLTGLAKDISILSHLKDKNYFGTYLDEAKNINNEIIPTLTQKAGILEAVEVPYNALLPQQANDKLEIWSLGKDTKISVQNSGSKAVAPIIYDNQALYKEVQPSIDQLVATRRDGVSNIFIIKDQSALSKAASGSLEVELDLEIAGLTAKESDGGVIFSDAQGNERYVLTTPISKNTKGDNSLDARFSLSKPVALQPSAIAQTDLSLKAKLVGLWQAISGTDQAQANTSEVQIEQGNGYKLKLNLTANRTLSFPILVAYDLKPMATRYVGRADSVCGQSVELLEQFKQAVPELMQNDKLEKIKAIANSETYVSKIDLPKSTTTKEAETGPGESLFNRKPKVDQIGVRTQFDAVDGQIRQNLSIKLGQEVVNLNINLQNSSNYCQAVYNEELGDTKIYASSNDLITYQQSSRQTGQQNIELKELIYALKPNTAQGTTRYAWDFSSPDDQGAISLELQSDGSVKVFQNMKISGVDKNDIKKQQRVMDLVAEALKGMTLDGKKQIAQIQPLWYQTKNGQRKIVSYLVENNSLIIDIKEDGAAYPLLIDPTLDWHQWMGFYSNGGGHVYALAVNGDEIYAGGSAFASNFWEAASSTGGMPSGSEGFVVELQDNATSSAPTINWLQWLGGTGIDDIATLAVNDNEIYAGGYSSAATSWEAAPSTGGTYSGSNEVFIVELQDNATSSAPTINWLQWLGGTGADYVYVLAVNGDEIYAGGYSAAATSWETASSTGGTYSGSNEVFVVELQDNATSSAPTINWLQWLGGTGADYITTLAVNDNEIYAGGYSSVTTSWEAASSTGGTLSGTEGFVVELQDNDTSSAPTINWLQWLGGTGADYIATLAVNSDEIYAGGYSWDATSWEAASSTGGTHSGSNEGFVVELQDNSTSSPPTISWLQWLGGTGADYITILAVNGDEIYAGGYSGTTISWEAASSTGGTHSGSDEGFVVELQDNATSSAPTINWLQWLGGAGGDYIKALAVNNDEIYTGEYSATALSWEAASSTGGTPSGNEGFVVELQDNATSSAPTINWLQWVGFYSNGADYVYALAVNGNEIYAGGYSSAATSWEVASSTGGTHSGSDEGFVVELQDNATSSAPTINWLQWLGGTGIDSVYALAVNDNEIYAGGYSNAATSWEVASSTGGTHSGSNEGFVVELQDNATSSAPIINWLQWLGGTGVDYVYALAVNNDEIYAGGSSANALSWEAASSTGGTHSGSDEGFVVELQDNAISSTPTINWLQWLGGSGADYVYALAVDGDEIYAGESASAATFWEAATSTGGTYSGGFEGLVVELQDNATSSAPTINWLQWLGGTGFDYVYAIAMNGNEIYAGGYSNDAISWEVASSTGGTPSGNEGFVVELQDNATSSAPTINWLQWLGGTGSDYVRSLTVNGDEIYAGGYSSDAISWEVASSTGGTLSGTEGFVIELQDNATSSAPIINWLQWLGGTGSDYVRALAVNGDEIYAGGFSDAATSWEVASSTGGTYSSGNEGFIIRIADDPLMSINLTYPISNASTSNQTVVYAFPDTALNASITFTQTSGTADVNSPHVCQLQSTALAAGTRKIIAMATSANACVSWANPLIVGAVYSVKLEATNAGGASLPVIHTNIAYVSPFTSKLFRKNVQFRQNVIIR